MEKSKIIKKTAKAYRMLMIPLYHFGILYVLSSIMYMNMAAHRNVITSLFGLLIIITFERVISNMLDVWKERDI